MLRGQNSAKCSGIGPAKPVNERRNNESIKKSRNDEPAKVVSSQTPQAYAPFRLGILLHGLRADRVRL